MSVESPNKTAHLWVFYCRNKKKDKQKRLPWQEAVFNVVDKLGRLSPTGRRFGPNPHVGAAGTTINGTMYPRFHSKQISGITTMNETAALSSDRRYKIYSHID